MAIRNVSSEQKYRFYDTDYYNPNADEYEENNKYKINKNANYGAHMYLFSNDSLIYCPRLSSLHVKRNINFEHSNFISFQLGIYSKIFYNPKKDIKFDYCNIGYNKFIDTTSRKYETNKFNILNDNETNNKCTAKYIFTKPNNTTNNINNGKFIMPGRETSSNYSKHIFIFNKFNDDKKFIIINNIISLDKAKFTINELHSFITTIVQLTNDPNNINKILRMIRYFNIKNIIIESLFLKTFLSKKITNIYNYNNGTELKGYENYPIILDFI
jgi:hypothetical protein